MTTYQIAAARVAAYQRHVSRLEAETHRRLRRTRRTLVASLVLHILTLVALAACI